MEGDLKFLLPNRMLLTFVLNSLPWPFELQTLPFLYGDLSFHLFQYSLIWFVRVFLVRGYIYIPTSFAKQLYETSM